MPSRSSEKRELEDLRKLGIGDEYENIRRNNAVRNLKRLENEAKKLGNSVKEMKKLTENKRRTRIITRSGRGRREKTRRKKIYKKLTSKRLNNAIKKFLTYKKRKFF